MTRCRTGWLTLGFAFACGCGGTADEPPNCDGAALQLCLPDLWLTPISGECVCGGAAPAPECAGADCEQTHFLWLRADGVAGEGFMLVSQELGTFSSFGAPDSFPYSLDGCTLTLEDGNREPREASCGGNDLTWGTTSYVRAPGGLAAALDAAWGDGSGWIGAPLTP